MADGKDILAAGGGGKKQRQPIEAPDSLHSVAYARVDDAVSEGPIKGLVNGLQSIFYNETPLQNPDGSFNFQRVQVDWRWGTQDQDPIPGFGTVENEIAANVEVTAVTPWTQAITNPALDGLRVLVSVPMLVKTDTSTGDTSGNSVMLAFDIATDGGAFVEVKRDLITGKTTHDYQRSYRFDLPKAVSGWVHRCRRLTQDSTSQTNVSNTYIASFTELVDAKLRYPNTAHITTSIDAAQFQSVPSRAFHLYGREIRVPTNYDAQTRTYTGIWDGTFKIAYTNNPAWIFYDLVTHRRYGLGHLVDAQQVNKWELYKIARWCDEMVDDGQGGTEPRLTCNVFLQTQEDAYKVLSDLAGAFQGVAYWAGGAINPSADMPADPVYCYTPANVVDGKFEYSGSGRRARHTVALVGWNDIRDFGRSKVEYVEDLDGIARYGVNQTELIAIGCTSRSQARRHGKKLLASERLLTDMVTFRIGLDGTFSAPGQIIQIADPLRMGDRMGGRISAATANSVTVDRLPETLPVAGDPLKVIGTDGRMMERVIASVDAGTRTITVTANFDSVPVQQSMWIVERANLSAPTYRVLSVVDEQDGTIYAITALRYDPAVHALADAPDELPPPPAGLDRSANPVTVATVTSFNRTTEYATETVVVADWQRPFGAMAYDVEWRKDEGEWIKQSRQVESRLEVTNARPGVYLFRIAAVNALGLPSVMRYTEAFVLTDDQVPPVAFAQLQLDASAAQTAADNAQASANAANTWINNAVSDGVISRTEKTPEVVRWAEAQNTLADIRAKADSYGVSRAAFDSGYNALSAYITPLNPALTDMVQDTVVDGPTYRARWATYLNERQLLLNGIAAKAKQLADAADLKAANAQSAADAAQTDADAAQASANVANTAIAGIVSDSSISRAEKTGEIVRWNAAQAELSEIDAKADQFGVSRSAYDSAFTALNSYISALTPAIGNVAQDTPVDGPTYRSRWASYLTERTNLLNAISVKTKLLADTALSRAQLRIADPGFETGTYDGTYYSDATGKILWHAEGLAGAWSVQSYNPFSGTRRLHLYSDTITGNAAWVGDTLIPCTPGDYLRVSVKAHSLYGSGTPGVMLQFLNLQTGYAGQTPASTHRNPGNDKWGDLVGYGPVPAGADVCRVIIHVDGYSASGAWGFDQVEVDRLPPNTDQVPDGTSTVRMAVEDASYQSGKWRNGLRFNNSGQQLAQFSVPPGGFANVGAAWITPGSISYTATAGSPATATINVSAITLRYMGVDITYSASSASVSGTNGSSVKYHLYYDDQIYQGGARTLGVTTDFNVVLASSARMYIATMTVTYPTSGSSTPPPTGPNPCVCVDALIDGVGRAGDVRKGNVLPLVNPVTFAERSGVVSFSDAFLAPCVRLHTSAGTLSCSTEAPIATSDGSPRSACNLSGHVVPVKVNGVWRHVSVDRVEDIGEQWVQRITCENDWFMAGDHAGCYFAHHNIKMTEP